LQITLAKQQNLPSELYKNKLHKDKIKYNSKYLDAPYRSESELNFEDFLKINTIKDMYEKEKQDMAKRQINTVENARNTEQKKYEDKFEKEKKVKIRQ
jgi:hypothetical protein